MKAAGLLIGAEGAAWAAGWGVGIRMTVYGSEGQAYDGTWLGKI
jgi:hypothetical protein